MDDGRKPPLRYKEGKGDLASPSNRSTRGRKPEQALHACRPGCPMSIPYILPQPGIPEIDIPSYDPSEEEDDD